MKKFKRNWGSNGKFSIWPPIIGGQMENNKNILMSNWGPSEIKKFQLHPIIWGQMRKNIQEKSFFIFSFFYFIFIFLFSFFIFFRFHFFPPIWPPISLGPLMAGDRRPAGRASPALGM